MTDSKQTHSQKNTVSTGVRLLIVTQAVDKNHPVLGFFHRWIEEFAEHFERIEVICLLEGEHSLPENVRVHSLGKEKGEVSKVVYSWRFLKLIWKLRTEYDAVFVHMNQEYVLLGAAFWKVWHKRIYMWRNHYAGSMLTRLAVLICDKVFCTSKHSYTAKFKRCVLMPVGVDTTVFKPDVSVQRNPRSILSLGRISPSKNIETLIKALIIMKEKGVEFSADIYGDALPQDAEYLTGLKELVREERLTNVSFHGRVKNAEAPKVYSSHSIFVNTSPSGMYDKTIFEAAACGCVVLASSRDFAGLAGDQFTFAHKNAEALAEKIVSEITLSEISVSDVRHTVEVLAAKNSLRALLDQLKSEVV